jgi:hypothetical protein
MLHWRGQYYTHARPTTTLRQVLCLRVITLPGATQRATEDAASTVQMPHEPTCAPESDRIEATAPGAPTTQPSSTHIMLLSFSFEGLSAGMVDVF